MIQDKKKRHKQNQCIMMIQKSHMVCSGLAILNWIQFQVYQYISSLL